jgi:hypothetical protein
MAFKPYDSNETQEHKDASQREMFDRSAFGHPVGKGEAPLTRASFQILASPLPEIGINRMLARDGEGMFEVILRGDRKPEPHEHSSYWRSVSNALAQQGEDPRDRAGLAVEATGMFGRMEGPNWKPGKEVFHGRRGFAIAEATIDLGNGQRMTVGRPLEKPAVGKDLAVPAAAPSSIEKEAAIDMHVFKGKPIRSVSLRVERGAFQSDASGDWTIGGANERGPIGLRLPADRVQAWQRDQAPAYIAFQAAQEGMKAQGDSRGLKIEAQGAFFRHTVESGGVARERWEFVATSFTFQHAGKAHEVGRAVALPEWDKTPVAPPKKSTRGQER